MGYEDYLASIGAFAGSYAPIDHIECQGQRLAYNQFPGLPNILGTLYGPTDWSTYFTIPNLSAATPLGVAAGGVTEGAVQPLAGLTWPNGQPAAVATGGTATAPTVSAANGVTMTYCICINGIWPSQY